MSCDVGGRRAAASPSGGVAGADSPCWVGTVSIGTRDLTGFEQGAKGVDGGAVRLVGSYAG